MKTAGCRTQSVDVSDELGDDGKSERTVSKTVKCRLVAEVERLLREEGVIRSVTKEGVGTPVSLVPDHVLRLLLSSYVEREASPLLETAPKPDRKKRREREQKRRETAARRRGRDRQERVRAKVLPLAPGI